MKVDFPERITQIESGTDHLVALGESGVVYTLGRFALFLLLLYCRLLFIQVV